MSDLTGSIQIPLEIHVKSPHPFFHMLVMLSTLHHHVVNQRGWPAIKIGSPATKVNGERVKSKQTHIICMSRL